MMYYLLNPEVSGELGDGCKIEYKNGMIHEITFLEYHFTGWMGDELLTAHPCFIVTKELEHDICAEGLTGVVFREIAVTFSDEFYEMCGDIKVPQFVQIICCFPYEASIDNLSYDFYFNKYKEMIVSERALAVLKQHTINECNIERIIG